jgi:sulfur-oxidizing protein SoxX
MRNRALLLAAVAAAATIATVLTGCAAVAPQPDLDAQFQKMMTVSFSDKGIAKVDRLQQDASDAACSKAAGAPLPPDQAEAIQAENLKSVKLPTDGVYLGDWKAGEKLAQDGKGMTWSDKSTAPQANGGSCYNCHQLSAAEISYGNVGPSLYHYGQTHGATDPTSPVAQPIVAYTWAKLYNAKAYNACSTMPRFGHAGLLDEVQLKNLMALLLDPKSPVNQ